MKKISKLHLGVYGILLKGEKILLIKKLRGPYKGKLDLPGGKLEHGEKILSGLKREIIEETGVIADNFKLLDNFTTKVSFRDNNENICMYHVGLIYRAMFINDKKIKNNINEEDSGGGEWYLIESLSRGKVSPFVFYFIKNIYEK
jgi:ADP-ribose pyrophosphatase YjhB (NUDIX family)